MASFRTASDGSVWQAMGGTARNFKNVATGETLARRQWDKKYGALARGGFSSYEAKAKSSPEPLRQSRPAFGRGSAKRSGEGSIRGLRPFTEKVSRSVVIPYEEESYNEAVRDCVNNSRILGVSIQALLSNRRVVTLERLTAPDSLSPFEAIEEAVENLSEVGSGGSAEVENLVFHIRFFEKSVPKSKRKQDIKESKRLKKVRDVKATSRAKRRK